MGKYMSLKILVLIEGTNDIFHFVPDVLSKVILCYLLMSTDEHDLKYSGSGLLPSLAFWKHFCTRVGSLFVFLPTNMRMFFHSGRCFIFITLF